MYNSLPRGGHYVSFVYYHFTKRQHTLDLHTNIIYIYIINAETQQNSPKSTETTFSQLFRNEAHGSPK